MNQISYILIKSSNTSIDKCFSPFGREQNIKHGVIVDSKGVSHEELIKQLVELRKHHPDAKILGLNELHDGKFTVDAKKNLLRREQSDCP